MDCLDEFKQIEDIASSGSHVLKLTANDTNTIGYIIIVPDEEGGFKVEKNKWD